MVNLRLVAILGSALVVLVLIAGAYIKGRGDGAELTRSEYRQRDLQTATETAAQIKGITTRYRAQEAQWTKGFTEAQRKYQRELDSNATYYLTQLATNVRLRDPGADNQACGNPATAVAANPGATNSGGTELSLIASNFLWDQAARADKVALKLNLCIDTLEAERAPVRP